MTGLTNAPPLPDEPLSLQMWRNSTIVLGGREHEMFQYIDKLRAQLEQSPMRESAIIEGLERQLAEARGEIDRLKADMARWLESEPNRALRLETARADACEKDARRWQVVCYDPRFTTRYALHTLCAADNKKYKWLDNPSEMESFADAALGAPT